MSQDLSYLTSPDARRYMVESYDREHKEKVCKTCKHRLNYDDEVPCDSCDDKSDWEQAPERLHRPIPGSRTPDTNRRE